MMPIRPRTLLYFLLCLSLSTTANAETYPVKTNSGDASAVCIGRFSKTGEWVFLTNRHVAAGTRDILVGGDDSKWHAATRIRLGRGSADVASFSVQGREGLAFRRVYFAGPVPDGADVTVCGYSPQREAFCFRGKLDGERVRAPGHVLPGDSGGPVIVDGTDGKRYLAGLSFGFGKYERPRRTWFVPTSACASHVRSVYGCQPRCFPYAQICPPDGRCPLPRRPPAGQINYERITPRFLAPPQVERYSQSIPSPQQERLEPEIVEPPSLSRAEVRSIVREEIEAWASANEDRFTSSTEVDANDVALILATEYSEHIRGERGRDGEPGPRGERGPAGKPGQDSSATSLTGVEKRLDDLEQRRVRVILMDNGTVVDDETLQPDAFGTTTIKLDNRTFKGE